jgi:uncharacterized protein with von Willebrand factor type A (vWA) domain
VAGGVAWARAVVTARTTMALAAFRNIISVSFAK